MALELKQKLEILADAAKYDASCASSGTERRNSSGTKGIGSTEGSGICHAYAPDGRCISLLKLLLTNFCVYECRFCINRVSSNTRRARFTVDEVVRLTMDFYKRNYIEGLFLSSGIIQSPDYTMEELGRVAKTLRLREGFRGYIHLKAIPDADPLIVRDAARWADRISLNVELPTETGLAQLAPEKRMPSIRQAMGRMRHQIEAARADPARTAKAKTERRRERLAPAGQSTQMIVGADSADDRAILGTSANLYAGYKLRRVYYSAFSPIPEASGDLPLKPPPLVREHRLYQADWLLRFYGFELDEIIEGGEAGMLDLTIDPKLAWALKHRELFPLDLNRAARETLMRVPGLGVRTVQKILRARRYRRLTLEDLGRLRVSLKKVEPFIITGERQVKARGLESEHLRRFLTPPRQQLDLFSRHA